MWKFVTASDGDGNPLLRSLNKNVGRQVWVFDRDAGTQEERQQAERLRQRFEERKHTQKHSSDELLRRAAAKCRRPVPRGPHPHARRA
jgi:hypothetical protein